MEDISKMKRTIAIILSAVMVVMCCVLTACEVVEPVEVTSENVWTLMDEYVNKIGYKNKELVKGTIPEGGDSSGSGPDIMYELPDITNYPVTVKGNGEVNVEIFVPTENNGSSIVKFIEQAATQFNSAGVKVNGKTASVSIRTLEATLAEDYILSGAYRPEGYIASNELYGILMNENGIAAAKVSDKLVGNVMGIAIQKAKNDELKSAYSEVSIKTIVDATKDGKLAVGYPNPTNNPTGLNFVISMLSYFDANNPMSFEATTDFSAFQSAVPLVSFSMDQMKQAANEGSINAFVVEGQAFAADSELSKNFVFMPFGVRHDNPLYAVGEVTSDENGVLQQFAEFTVGTDMQKYANELGFNANDAYTSTVANYEGSLIKEVLEVWKNARVTSGKTSVVFVADVSGSMDGDKIESLKQSLLNGMQYISEETRVGLITFESTVYVDVPIGEFNTEQQEYFAGAAENLRANGGTSTNNAILVASKILHSEPEENKKLIIVLSDGQTGSGYSLSSVKSLIDNTEIPIYTIGYGNNADEKELKEIANINTGTYIKATSDNIGYLMKTIFNAEA